MDLLLSEHEQVAVRSLIAAGLVPSLDLPGDEVLPHLARLIACDASGLALLDGSGWVVARAKVGRARADEEDVPVLGRPAALGVRHRPSVRGGSGARCGAVLTLGVRNATRHVVVLWLVRRTTDFSGRDRALLDLVAPALERVLRERPPPSPPPSLTLQERRVLLHAADGCSNAEIAARLSVAPGTVRKHLENAYRKLGVSNRLAAVHALAFHQPRAWAPGPLIG